MYKNNVVLKTEIPRVTTSLSNQFPEVLQFAKGIKNNQSLSKNIKLISSVKHRENNSASSQNFFKRDQELNIENLRNENIKIKGILNNYIVEKIKLTSEMMKMEKENRKIDKLEKFVEDVKEKKKNINEDEIVAKLKKVNSKF